MGSGVIGGRIRMRHRIKMMRLVLPLLAVITVGMAGCARSNQRAASASVTSAPAATAANHSRGHRVVVYLIDATGSYNFVGEALSKAAAEIERNAQPGDVWFFRWITNASYGDSTAVFTLRCPDLPEAPTNPFDSNARRRWQAQQASFTGLKRKAATMLRSQRPRPVRGTDIYGAFAKASDIFETTVTQGEKVVVIATDLGDTENRKVPFSLRGVRVIICLYQGGGRAQEARARRDYWVGLIRRAGAEQIRVLDPAQSSVEDLLGER
jgi:hypothetical protein